MLGNPKNPNAVPLSNQKPQMVVKDRIKEKPEIEIGGKHPKVVQKVAVPVQKIKKDDLKVEVNTKINSKIQDDKKSHADELKKTAVKNDKNTKTDKNKNDEKNLTISLSPENLKAIHDHKVGWEYRYRVNNFVEKLKSNPNININDKKMNKERIEEKKEENETIVYDGPKPKVGWQNRYRISKFINAGGNVNSTGIKLEKKSINEEKVLEKDNIKKDEEEAGKKTILIIFSINFKAN